MVKSTNSKSHIMNHLFCFFPNLLHGNTREVPETCSKSKLKNNFQMISYTLYLLFFSDSVYVFCVHFASKYTYYNSQQILLKFLFTVGTHSLGPQSNIYPLTLAPRATKTGTKNQTDFWMFL